MSPPPQKKKQTLFACVYFAANKQSAGVFTFSACMRCLHAVWGLLSESFSRWRMEGGGGCWHSLDKDTQKTRRVKTTEHQQQQHPKFLLSPKCLLDNPTTHEEDSPQPAEAADFIDWTNKWWKVEKKEKDAAPWDVDATDVLLWWAALDLSLLPQSKSVIWASDDRLRLPSRPLPAVPGGEVSRTVLKIHNFKSFYVQKI